MAEASLQIVLENLASMMQKELGLLWGLEKQMEKLCSILKTIKAVLADAEEKQFNDKPITDWLRKLNAAVYKADDILDEWATEASRLERKSSKVPTFLTCFLPENIWFSYKIAKKIVEVIERLDEIAEERKNFHFNEVVRESRVGIAKQRQTGFIPPSVVYGREEDKEKVVKCLVEDIIDCYDVSVYPIVGMGGLGKTTLAQSVYTDERVRRHFEIRIWVCVSDDFDVRMLIKAMIEDATGNACDDLGLAPLQKSLQELLSGKRFLLVLDDVWSDDQDKWYKLKRVLTSTSKGASIVVTTRMKRVASVMGTLPELNLSSLSENDCWLLFKERAFSGGREEDESSTIIAIGKKIVKKCGGVPLAVQALGGLMCDKSGEKQWRSVLESKIWDLPQNESSILPALRLSYTNLPLELRKCFVYCAIYPKDSMIVRDDLIQLWMANGYVSSTTNMELEDVGNQICDELYWRSLIQEVSTDNLGNIKTFKMHDLVHDLAQSLIGNECWLPNGESSTDFSRKACHVHLISTTPWFTVPKTLYATESLRTLLLTTTWGSSAEASSPLDFSRLRTLRVFSGGVDDPTIVSSIGRLKHLRYLRLFSRSIELPVSICSLINLQTLNLAQCYCLATLPKTLSCMKNLRHLHLYHDSPLLYMPPNIGQMRFLKTLSLFIVGKGNNPDCSQLVELQCLNLGGDLHIKHLERVVNLMHAKEVNFAGKHDLRCLSLSWDLRYFLEQPESVEKVLEALEPHPNLECLELDGYNGTRFPCWMNGGILRNVTRIMIVNCKNCLQLPSLGELPSLKELEIHGAEHISCIDNDGHGDRSVTRFPLLSQLGISQCPKLTTLLSCIDNDGHGDGSVTRFPRLSRLRISQCPKLTTLPCLPSIKDFTVFARCLNGDDEIVELPHEMLQNLASLESLKIKGLTKLKCLSTELGSLSGLKNLRISMCDEFESFSEHALQGLGSLQDLSIQTCKKFNSLSEGLQHLTSLERLEISQCPDLVAFPDGIKHLHSLQEVSLIGIEAFPDGLHLQYISSLKSLEVRGCPNLVSSLEWLGNLTSLQSLFIDFGRTQSSFPSTMQRLTNLKILTIYCCNPMRERYEKERGEEWYKIAHVSDVFFYVMSWNIIH